MIGEESLHRARIVRRTTRALAALALLAFALGYVTSGVPFGHLQEGGIAYPLFLGRSLAVDLAPARDGIVVTPREEGASPRTLPAATLVQHGIFERSVESQLLEIGLFADVASLERIVPDLDRATLSRLRSPAPHPTRAVPTQAQLFDAAIAAARYLARVERADGTFAYLVDGANGHELVAEYSWARHAGATIFLREASEASGDGFLAIATDRARSALVGALSPCGTDSCLASGDEASIGTAALAALALENGDEQALQARSSLLEFVKHSVRADGGFHRAFRRREQMFEGGDELYTDGEAALALAHVPAAARLVKGALGRIASRWSFFGARYYPSQEHWTCAAAFAFADGEESGARALCEQTFRIERALQIVDGSPDDGAFGVGPLPLPQVAQTASRGEGWLALYRGHDDRPFAKEMKEPIRRLLASLLRSQAVVVELSSEKELVRGALPMSRADLRLRIDVTQHAGSLLLRASQTPALFAP